MKVLLTGGSGLIGSRLKELNEEYEIVSPDIPDFDITNQQVVDTTINGHKPDYVFHFAAYTNTQEAQTNPEKSKLINVTGTQHVIQACKSQKCPILFLSTDFVFDGLKGSYKEEDTPNPTGEYAKHKLMAENAIKASGLNWLIVRTAYPYRAQFEPKTDCVRWMLPKLANKETLTLVNDQYVTPTFVDELVRTIFTLVSNRTTGLYHVSGSECLNFLEIGKKVCEVWGYDPRLISEISLDEFNKKSGRVNANPQKSCLNTSKLKEKFGLTLSDFKTGLTLMKQQMEEP